MSAEEMKRLSDDIKSDAALAEQFKGISNVDGMVAKANEKGYGISASDVNSATNAELSDDQLEGAAGGAGVSAGGLVGPNFVHLHGSGSI